MLINNNFHTFKDQRSPGRTSLFLKKYALKGIYPVLAVLTLLGATAFQTMAATRETPPAPGSKDVTYPVNMFDNGKARHFEFKTNDGVTIRYFLMKSSDGVIRAAFDTCVVCWRERKGYVQKDDFMICKNCGKLFQSTKINVVTGGCNPAPLTRKVENGKVILKVASLLEGKQFFSF